ncbi:hypothetical protein [Leptospira interrogans]|uniref:GAF domain-containing protein n=1 Tax=Leptospira interrogans serovar Canicola TaxID=211880 RepID=A0AAP9WGH9_LEPIR|nr:hypothetical protein [Leptospira interrogans]EMN73302.1 hypothetical protein LEP1GSC100_0391 [Leptospira interrogans serovar Bataviae str. UI 08561]QOI45026.1 hypothetical protein Lepto782_22790 [Leptospira interrogans serovar Canicola]
MKVKIFQLLIDIIIFSGIPLIKAAEDPSAKHYIGEQISDFIKNHDLVFVCTIIAIFLLKRTLGLFEAPVGIETVDEFNKIISGVFTDIIREYSLKVQEVTKEATPSFRINIMIRTKKFYILDRMKIYYFSSSVERVHYKEVELEYMWKKKEGACGHAWNNRRPCIFDRKNSHFKSPAKTLKSEVKDFTDKIGSIISIPIWSKNGQRPIYGILSIDSSFTIERTLFDRENIIDLLSKHIDRLSLILDKLKVGIRR